MTGASFCKIHLLKPFRCHPITHICNVKYKGHKIQYSTRNIKFLELEKCKGFKRQGWKTTQFKNIQGFQGLVATPNPEQV